MIIILFLEFLPLRLLQMRRAAKIVQLLETASVNVKDKTSKIILAWQ